MLKLQNHQSSDANPEPLIAWPGLHNLRLTLLLSLLVFVIFCLFFTGAGAITAMHSWRLHLFFDFEPGIPYVPQWGVVYFSMNGLFALAPFIFRHWQGGLPLAVTLIVETLIASLVFVLLPLEAGFSPHSDAGLMGDIFRWAELLYLDHNYLPSLHVTFAMTTALAYSRRCRLAGRCIFLMWALAIAASTIFIHAHHLLDVVAGIALALVSMRLVYEPGLRTTGQVLRVKYQVLGDAS